MDPRDPRPSQRPRSLIDEAEGQIQLLPVGNVTGDERAHARNKSSIFDVLNNEFDRAVKFFSNKTWLYAHLKYEPTNFLLFLFFLTSNSTRQLVWISLSLRALKPQSSTRQLLRENFLPSSKVFIDTEREFEKVLEDKIKWFSKFYWDGKLLFSEENQRLCKE